MEIKDLLKKHSLLENKLVNSSSLAEKLKMEKVTKAKKSEHYHESIDNALATLLNDGVINFERTYMAHDSVSLSIENIKFIDFLDFYILLLKDENIEISNVDIKSTKNENYINGQIILRKK
ncbi:hypothetical protein ACF3VQ_04200 [Yersinia sp. HM-2024]|uniref:hypothetical protein n=1 Tax=Yersinia sp. HM-2024 TaxID=3344550 RepID=UPI00370CFF85